jgi:2'-5' RNA ligase
VFSVTVPVPESVRERSRALRPALSGFERIRPPRSRQLVAKRLPAETRREFLTDARNAKAALAPVDPFEVRIPGIDTFADPPRGPGPVAYLAVASAGLERVHERLVEAFDAVPGLEGPDYVPHLTLARGGPPAAADSLVERPFEPIRFSVERLSLYDTEREQAVESVDLTT